MLKAAAPDRLVEAVQVVAAGEALLAPSVTRGVLALGVYGFVATFQADPHFGRILAAYGAVFVAGSLACGIVFDGFRPDRWDLLGSLICVVGVSVIMYAPRAVTFTRVGRGDEHARISIDYGSKVLFTAAITCSVPRNAPVASTWWTRFTIAALYGVGLPVRLPNAPTSPLR